MGNKHKVVYTEKYEKCPYGITRVGREEQKLNIDKADTVHLMEAGKYSDGKEYAIIKIDRIPTEGR